MHWFWDASFFNAYFCDAFGVARRVCTADYVQCEYVRKGQAIRKSEQAKPAEKRSINQTEYWKSLSRSFDKQFVDEARSKYDKRKRLQMA